MKGSDNDYPSILVTEQGSAPASPAASHQRMYIRTSDHTLVTVNSSGTVTPVGSSSGLTDPMTTRGDVIVRNASNVTARLAVGAAGTFLGRSGSDVLYVTPPGTELDYVEITSAVNITATTEATATTIITGGAVSYDGSTRIRLEFLAPYWQAIAGDDILVLYDGSSSIGFHGLWSTTLGGATTRMPNAGFVRYLTPSNASHTYSVRAYVPSGTGIMGAGAGGNGAHAPAFLRITKA